ncbi:dextranase [Paenibacillus sophorae]|uniref:Dextranase n=2 Tax=Paenibacillus sophorae TaxID=1333845 RepID=A0A1H8JGS0_9BACL|nr:dextranase [Paenibacillus sophorae]
MNRMFPTIKDAYPNKAQYITGEPVCINVELNNQLQHEVRVRLTVELVCMNRVLDSQAHDIVIPPGAVSTHLLTFGPPDEAFRGYGVDLQLTQDEAEPMHFSTAFDVVSSWRQSPRYGFLSDFHSREQGDAKDVESLNKLHINLVQFYDWMYRHDDLVPPEETFNDLMGRELSLKVVKEKIALCHSYGMKAMAYGAIYAASKDFYWEHPDWALYYGNGKVVDFIDIFTIMNISEESPWHRHIIGEYKKAIEQVGFDGIHMDTYGYPKTGISRLGGVEKVERLEKQFPVLIENTRKELNKSKEDIGLIFNNVGNWPVDTVAAAAQDAVYIEVWNPYEKYHHIQQIIAWAQQFGHGKPVILAAYLKPFRLESPESIDRAHAAALLLSAVIFSHGAYHLLLGENNGVLTQGYYVDYSVAGDAFMREIRTYYDFMVRYVHLLYDPSLRDVSMTHVEGDNLEYIFGGASYSTYGEPGKVWTVVRENEKMKLIQFINLTNNAEDYWNEGKNRPAEVKNLTVRVQVSEPVRSVFTASPDIDMGRPHDLEYSLEESDRGYVLSVTVPSVYQWSMLVIGH